MRDEDKVARTPPHSIEAEKSVLGSVFIKPTVLAEISDLAVDDLFLPVHREILDAMRAVNGRGRPVDVIEVADELKVAGMLSRLDGGQSYLNDLANAVPTAENAAHYARMVREKATLRRLINTCAEIQSQAYGNHGDVAGFIDEARAKMAAIESSTGDGATLLGDEIETALISIEERGKNPAQFFVPTNLAQFNDKVGGMRGGNLIVVAGRPGQGKSAWTLDIMINAAFAAIPGLMFSFEMTKIENVERALAKHGEVNGRNIITGRLNTPEWHKMRGAARQLREIPLSFDTDEMTAPRVCAAIRRWYYRQRVIVADGSRRRLAIAAVDYAGLVKSTGKEETRAMEIAVLSGSLKRLAAELDIPIILVSQLNRESEKADREPRLSDLRESGALEQDANMVLFPYWEGAAPRQGTHPARIIIGKNRGGPVGHIPCLWMPEYMKFVDDPDYVPEQPVQQELYQ